MEAPSKQINDCIRYTLPKMICGVMFFDNDTILAMGKHSWSSIDVKTGVTKLHAPFDHIFQDFSLSKNGRLALATSNELHVYNAKTGGLFYCKDIGYTASPKKVAFSSDNEKIIIFNMKNRFLFISATNQYQYKESLIFEPFVYSFMAINPHNNDLFIANKAKKKRTPHSRIVSMTKEKQVVMMIDENNVYRLKKNIRKNNQTVSCEYNPNGTVMAINDYFKGYQFYNTDDYKKYLTIGAKNSLKTSYTSIAFHPKKSFIALINIKNCIIEFWNYIKRAKKPFLVKKIEKIEYPFKYIAKCVAFSPDGKFLAVINGLDKKLNMIPIEDVEYQYTLPECVFVYWIMKNFKFKNFNSLILPRDIINVITYNIFCLPDIQLITHKLEKRKQLRKQQKQQVNVATL